MSSCYFDKQIKFDNMGMFIMDNGVSHRIKMDSEGKYYIKSQDDKEFVLTEYDQQILSLRQSKRVNI